MGCALERAVGGGEGEGIGDVLELGAGGQKVNGEDVQLQADGGAVSFGQALQIGGGELAELALLGFVHLGGGGREIAGGAGFDLEDNEGRARPGDQVEVTANAGSVPAAGDDGVAARAQMEEGGVFSAQAGEQVRRQQGFAVGTGAEGGVSAAFEGDRD